MRHETIVPPAARAASLVQRALGGHAAIGLIAGALLYVVALSGTLVVIHERWQRWEQPAVAEATAVAPRAVQRAVAAGMAKDAGKPPTTHLYVHLPTDDLPRTVVTTDHGAIYVDGAGRPAAPEAHGWTEFAIALHETLHLPSTVGLIVVGALGTMLAALAVTGVLAHPRILRDAFRLRARGNRQLAHADWHNRLGVWTLPFTIVLALTGAFIGLAAVNGDVLARAYHGGDLLKVYAPIFGAEAPADRRPAPVADVATALATLAAQAPDARPTYVTIHDPGTAGQHVQILADLPRRLIYGETYLFDAAGRPAGRLGLADGATGKQVAASVYRLHFGNFGGLAVELAYIAFGLALCVVTATGMSLWLMKRRRRGSPSPRLEAFWTATIWGVPLALVACAWLRAAGGAAMPFAALFWAGLGLGVVAAMVRPRLAAPMVLRRLLAAALAVTALGHLGIAPPDRSAVLGLDAALLALAAILALVDRYRRTATAVA